MNEEINTRDYKIRLVVLGNEILLLSLSTTSENNKWAAWSAVTIFSVLVVLGAYGDKLISLYHSL